MYDFMNATLTLNITVINRPDHAQVPGWHRKADIPELCDAQSIREGAPLLSCCRHAGWLCPLVCNVSSNLMQLCISCAVCTCCTSPM